MYKKLKKTSCKKESLDKLKTLKILYAEDEYGIRKKIVLNLTDYVQEVIEASNGQEAFDLYEEKKPDIILCDIYMPILNGIDFVKKVRENNRNIPIIMITAHTNKEYLLDIIDLHIEKFLVKPIEMEALFDILIACTKFFKINKTVSIEVDKNYKYDYDKKELYYKNNNIILNKKMLLFLEVLLSNQNRISTYEELQEKVWGANIMTDSAIRSLVRNLRKKLPTDIIYNLSGSGYRFS